MCRELFHIYGPISINSYGTLVLIGIVTGLWLFLHDPRREKCISTDHAINAVFFSIIIALLGGRLLAVAQEPQLMSSILDFFAFWQGGLSFLGGVISLVMFLPLYFRYVGAPVLPTLDLTGIYALCMEGIARLGCFMAGCCYGQPTDMPWGVVYKNHDSLAPLYEKIHPTQLYSAALALTAFFLLNYLSKKLTFVPGQICTLYLMMVSAIRFNVDFWRADREYVNYDSYFLKTLSVHQWIALTLFVGAAIAYVILEYTRPNTKNHGSI